MMTPVTPDEAKALAVWLGQLYPHLGDEQVREFRLLFERCAADRATIERAVRHYLPQYPYATYHGIADAIVGQRRRDVAAAESAARRLDVAAAVEHKLDELLADVSEVELRELRLALMENWPPSVRERTLRAVVDPRTSPLVRSHFRALAEQQVREQLDGKNSDGNAISTGRVNRGNGEARAESA